MAEIKGHGVPGGHIEGAVGDIYVDERTGLKYICTFAYTSSSGNGRIYEWRTTGERVDIKRQTNRKEENHNEKNDI